MSVQIRHCLGAILLCGVFSGGLAHAADPLKGKDKSTICAACHGADGNSLTPEFPRIAGQHEDYLFRALLDYKHGLRKNPIMAAQVENLEKQDLADLAAWFASQKGLVFKR